MVLIENKKKSLEVGDLFDFLDYYFWGLIGICLFFRFCLVVSFL